jgi:hypothetical protein
MMNRAMRAGRVIAKGNAIAKGDVGDVILLDLGVFDIGGSRSRHAVPAVRDRPHRGQFGDRLDESGRARIQFLNLAESRFCILEPALGYCLPGLV